jgi:hypothetical protein
VTVLKASQLHNHVVLQLYYPSSLDGLSKDIRQPMLGGHHSINGPRVHRNSRGIPLRNNLVEIRSNFGNSSQQHTINIVCTVHDDPSVVVNEMFKTLTISIKYLISSTLGVINS